MEPPAKALFIFQTVQAEIANIGGILNTIIRAIISGFGTAAAEKVRIDSSGNMGVGNPSPAYKLSVLTTGTTDTSLHLATTGGASDNGDATNSIRFTGGNNTRWANAKYEAFCSYISW